MESPILTTGWEEQHSSRRPFQSSAKGKRAVSGSSLLEFGFAERER